MVRCHYDPLHLCSRAPACLCSLCAPLSRCRLSPRASPRLRWSERRTATPSRCTCLTACPLWPRYVGNAKQAHAVMHAHAHTLTYMHMFTHTRSHARTRAHSPTCTCSRTRTHTTHTLSCMHIHTVSHTHTHVHCTRVHTHAHARTRMHALACTHTLNRLWT